jgi:peptidoglycan/LPS O-acetylase OafA/YrhL
MGRQKTSAGRRLTELDGLRGIAAMGVVLFHCFGGAFFWMWSFVDLFFVLSGFLITGILLREPLTLKALRNFWIRRILRIWPVYYLALGSVLMIWILARVDGFGWAQRAMPPIWPYVFFVQFYETYAGNWLDFNGKPLFGYGHSWSLAVEEQFYLLWPFVLLLISRSRPIMASACIGIVLLSTAMRLGGWPQNVLLSRADGLALGALLSLILNGSTRPSDRLSAVLVVVLLFGLGLVFHFLTEGYGNLLAGEAAHVRGGYDGFALQVTGFSMIYFSVVGLIAVGALPTLIQLLRTRLLVYLGTISYAVYMFHMPILLAVSNWVPVSGMLRGLLIVMITVSVSELVRRWIERPANVLKARYAT